LFCFLFYLPSLVCRMYIRRRFRDERFFLKTICAGFCASAKVALRSLGRGEFVGVGLFSFLVTYQTMAKRGLLGFAQQLTSILRTVSVIRLKTCGFLPLYLNPVVFGFPENICAGCVCQSRIALPWQRGSPRESDFFLF